MAITPPLSIQQNILVSMHLLPHKICWIEFQDKRPMLLAVVAVAIYLAVLEATLPLAGVVKVKLAITAGHKERRGHHHLAG